MDGVVEGVLGVFLPALPVLLPLPDPCPPCCAGDSWMLIARIKTDTDIRNALGAFMAESSYLKNRTTGRNGTTTYEPN